MEFHELHEQIEALIRSRRETGVGADCQADDLVPVRSKALETLWEHRFRTARSDHVRNLLSIADRYDVNLWSVVHLLTLLSASASAEEVAYYAGDGCLEEGDAENLIAELSGHVANYRVLLELPGDH